MKSITRLLPFVVALAAVVLAFAGLGLSPIAWFDGRTLAFTLLAPWIALAVADDWNAPWVAFCDGLCEAPEELPRARRERSVERLRGLAGTTTALGLAAGLLAVFGGLNAMALAGGRLVPGQELVAMGGAVLGPTYGLLFAGLLYGPLAARIEGAGSELGDELRGS